MKPSRRSQVEPFRVMEVLDAANRRAREGHPVFHLEAGQPSTMAPRLALEAAGRALTSMTLGYTEALGIPMLRERISRHYHEAYGLQVSADRVIVTTGSSAAFVLAFLLAFDAGQSLAIANPGYPAYRNIARALDLRTHLIDCGIERGFRMSARDLAGVKADGVLIASPSNPCGTVMPPDDIREIAAHCRRNGMALISDEIYHGLTYDCTAETALAFDQGAIVINSFSKYYSMTGWRIGWMIVPQDMVASVERLTQNFYISPPTISQVRRPPQWMRAMNWKATLRATGSIATGCCRSSGNAVSSMSHRPMVRSISTPRRRRSDFHRRNSLAAFSLKQA